MKTPTKKLSPFAIALTYAVIAGLWIFFSDWLLADVIQNSRMLTKFQTYKGWFFVAVTTLILYLLLKGYQSIMTRYNHDKERLLISEQRSRTEAENSKKQVTEILERVSDACVSLDKNWIYTYVNTHAAQLFNRKPEQLIGKHIWTEFPEGIDQPFYKAYYKALEEQNPLQLEEYYKPWDRWFENRIYPSRDGLTIFFHDITARKKAEDALIKSEERLRILFDNTSDGILLADIETKRFLAGNKKIYLMLGCSEEELTALSVFDIHPEEDLPYVIEQFEKLSRKEIITARHIPVKRRDGGIFYVDINSSRIVFDGKDCLLGIFRDITVQWEAEKKIRSLNEELEEKVRQRTKELETKTEELERLNKVFVGRELRMKELKEKIAELERRAK